MGRHTYYVKTSFCKERTGTMKAPFGIWASTLKKYHKIVENNFQIW